MDRTPGKNRLLYVILAIFIQVSLLPAQAQALCMAQRSLGLGCCQRHASTETSGHAEVRSCCAKKAVGSLSDPAQMDPAQMDPAQMDPAQMDPAQKKQGHPEGRRPCTCEHRLPDASFLPDGPADLRVPPILLRPLEAFGWFLAPFESQTPIHPVAPRARTGPSLSLLYQVCLV